MIVAAPRTLEELTRQSAGELERTYREGSLPDLDALDGTPAGRMLALRGPLGWPPLAAGVRGLAARAWFPWRGKSFRTVAPGQGEGINRVSLAGLREWYPFQTRVDASAIDERPCVLLDYDLPDNPWFIRKIRDELRQVGPRLFLGPAMLQLRDRPRLVLFFAIDAR